MGDSQQPLEEKTKWCIEFETEHHMQNNNAVRIGTKAI